MTSPGSSSTRSRQLFREPLLRFAVLGTVAYLGLSALHTPPRGTIELSEATAQAILQERAEELGRKLTTEERRAALQERIDDEVLLREARRLGLDRTEPDVRERLERLLRLVLEEPDPEPTRAELEAYHRSHAERYRTPERVTFTLVYFASGSPRTPSEPARFLDSLRSGSSTPDDGEEFWAGTEIRSVERAQVRGLLGKEIADAVFDLPMATWTGPLSTPSGIFYVKVRSREDPEPAPTDSIQHLLRHDIGVERKREVLQRRIAELRSGYEIIVEEVR